MPKYRISSLHDADTIQIQLTEAKNIFIFKFAEKIRKNFDEIFFFSKNMGGSRTTAHLMYFRIGQCKVPITIFSFFRILHKNKPARLLLYNK